jgi:hypothetical protein
MSDLISHIKKINEDQLFKLVETPEHWAKYGIETVDQFERYQTECAFVEAWKGCYGVRHNGSLDHFTNDELDEMTQELTEQRLYDEVL